MEKALNSSFEYFTMSDNFNLYLLGIFLLIEIMISQ